VQDSSTATNLLYAGEQFDADSQHYYERAGLVSGLDFVFRMCRCRFWL